MKYWIIDDDFLSEEIKQEADAQGYLEELIRCKDCVYDHRCTHEMVMRKLPGGSLMYCPVTYCSEGRRKEK